MAIIAAVAANDAVAAREMTRRNFGRYWKGAGPDIEKAPRTRSRALDR